MEIRELPSFKLLNAKGTWITSDELPKPVVLFFYPKNNTPVCTKEVCAFRDHFATFREAGVAVFGISNDSIASHEQFSKSYGLPYELLSDPSGQVSKLLGVRKMLGLFPGRVTFVINEEGKIIHIFDSPLKAEQHALEALKALNI